MESNIRLRLIFFLVAILCAGLAARRGYIDRSFDRESTNVIATLLPGSTPHASKASFVHYSFTLPDGRVFTHSQGGYSGNPGQKILVEYVPSRPEWNRVAGSRPMENRLRWVLGIAAAVFLLIAARLKGTLGN